MRRKTKADLWVTAPEGLVAHDYQTRTLPRIGDGWLYKTGKNNILNELAGYQLASALQVPVPDYRFFVVKPHCHNKLFSDTEAEFLRVGLLTKEVSGSTTRYADLLRSNSDSGICHLSLRIFSTSEWPELINTKQDTLAIDLEFVLAHWSVTFFNAQQALHASIDAYREQTRHEFQRCYIDAEQVGLENIFLKELRQKLTLAGRHFLPNFGPLENGRLIEDFFRFSFEVRKDMLEDLINCTY